MTHEVKNVRKSSLYFAIFRKNMYICGLNLSLMSKSHAIRFSLLNAGFAADNERWNFGPVNSSFSRIYLVTAGEAFVEFGGNRHRLTPGHLYLIPAFTTHYDISHGPFEHYYVHFIDSAQDILDFFLAYDLPFGIDEEPGDLAAFRSLMASYPGYALKHALPNTYDNSSTTMQSLQKFENQSLGRKMQFNGIVHLLLARFFLRARQRMQVTDDRISKALWLIERDTAHAPSLDELAAQAMLGKERFIRLFKRQTGQTPTAYIIGKKIMKAQIMLLSKRYTIKEVAYRMGYDSQSYFGRQFKQMTGMSPMRFVMQNR